MFYKSFIAAAAILLSSFSFAEGNISSYQEEFVFLKNQLGALQKRKTKVSKQLQDLELKLKRSIQSLNGQVSKAESKNEILKSKISMFDESRTDEVRNVKKVEVVKSQMQEFSLKQGVESEDLNTLMTSVLSYLERGAGEFSVKGTAFNKKGVKEEGEVHSLGHVASYFSKGDDYIALATNSSKTGMVFTDHSISKKALMGLSGGIKSMPVSLKEGELVKEKSIGLVLRQKLDAGGAVGYVILFLGLLGVGVAVIRYNLIKGYTGFREDEVRDLVERIQSGNIDGAKKLLYEQRNSPVNHFVDLLLSCRHKTDEVYETIVVGEISKIQSTVSKYGPYLLVLAAVAPLLGLLGTVTGMIGTFDMITVHGTGNPKILSGGIKEALVTTQMGLIVAIPCILAGNYLSSQALKVVNKFEEVASSIPKV